MASKEAQSTERRAQSTGAPPQIKKRRKSRKAAAPLSIVSLMAQENLAPGTTLLANKHKNPIQLRRR